MSEKRRYKNYHPQVLSTAQEDELLQRQAKEIREIYDQKKTPPFEVAFFLYDQYQIWKKQNDVRFNFYLYNLIEAGRLKSKKSTLKLAYKVATCFPDLRDATKRQMPFDSYREIANTKNLDQSQMNELRKDAEENRYSGRKIREIITKMLGNDREEDEPKEKYFQKYIPYKNDEQFVEAVKAILAGPERPEEGTKFLLKKLRR